MRSYLTTAWFLLALALLLLAVAPAAPAASPSTTRLATTMTGKVAASSAEVPVAYAAFHPTASPAETSTESAKAFPSRPMPYDKPAPVLRTAVGKHSGVYA